jgi:hypothetical protein
VRQRLRAEQRHSGHVRVAEQLRRISSARHAWRLDEEREGLEHQADHGGIGDFAEYAEATRSQRAQARTSTWNDRRKRAAHSTRGEAA